MKRKRALIVSLISLCAASLLALCGDQSALAVGPDGYSHAATQCLQGIEGPKNGRPGVRLLLTQTRCDSNLRRHYLDIHIRIEEEDIVTNKAIAIGMRTRPSDVKKRVNANRQSMAKSCLAITTNSPEKRLSPMVGTNSISSTVFQRQVVSKRTVPYPAPSHPPVSATAKQTSAPPQYPARPQYTDATPQSTRDDCARSAE